MIKHESKAFIIGGDPNFSIGVGGSAGYYGVYRRKGDMDWNPGLGYSGGIVIERMFTNRFGLHTGIWGTWFQNELEYEDEVTLQNETADCSSWMVTVPLYLITSFNTKNFSFNLLTGFNFSHLLFCDISKDDGESDDVSIYMNDSQIGLALGFNLKFRVGYFTDFFIGVIGDGYLTELMTDDTSNLVHLYDARVMTGFMMRTNIFPIDDFYEE